MTQGLSLRAGAWQAPSAAAGTGAWGTNKRHHCPATRFSCWRWFSGHLSTAAGPGFEAEGQETVSCCPTRAVAISSCLGALPPRGHLLAGKAGSGTAQWGWHSWPGRSWQGHRETPWGRDRLTPWGRDRQTSWGGGTPSDCGRGWPTRGWNRRKSGDRQRAAKRRPERKRVALWDSTQQAQARSSGSWCRKDKDKKDMSKYMSRIPMLAVLL